MWPRALGPANAERLLEEGSVFTDTEQNPPATQFRSDHESYIARNPEEPSVWTFQ